MVNVASNGRVFFCRSCALLAAMLLSGLGCSKPSADTEIVTQSTDEIAPSAGEAETLLRKVREVYANAVTYTDNATVVFYGVPRATGTERVVPYTESYIAFERPNLLHVSYSKSVASPQEEVYEVVSNGLVIRSSANEVPDQTHEAVAPVRLTAENFIPEPALRGAILENSIENSLPQLAMLLAESVEQDIFFEKQRFRQLADGSIGGDSFHRLEWSEPVGKRVLWIDPQQYTIRRMEIPIDNQRKILNASNQYSTVSVWIDFEGVEIDAKIDPKVFEMEVPEESRRVRRFIPPPPAAPPEYLGRPIAEFEYESLDGESVTPSSLAGKVTVLDFWTTQCPPCRAQTPVLNEVYQHFRDSDDFSFLAVSLDSRVVANETVANTLSNWGGEMPIVRDRKSTSVNLLNVRQTPTLLVVDREGRLQSFQVGAHRSAKPLIEMLQRMIDGEDLAASERSKHAEFVAKYEAALDAAEIQDSIVEVEVVRPEVPERKLPQRLRMQQLWQLSEPEVGQPGAVLLAKDGARVLSLDDGQAIVEVSRDGKLIGRHALPDHPERAGGILRTWSNDQGEQWTLASGAGWQQVYVFDDQWEQVLAFPDEQHSGIGDVVFEDLTGSGVPVIHVGYWGGLGIQGGTLDGRRLWSNRRLDHVLQVGVGPPVEATDDGTPPRRSLVATSTRGTFMQLGSDGKSMAERYVPGQALMYFASQADGQAHCGLSIGAPGEYTAVGFASDDQVTWEYPLPPGEYAAHVPRVQSVTMPDGTAAWMVVAANGALHWLDFEGELIARFDYGAVVTGVSMCRLSDRGLLVVATSEGLTAWEMLPGSDPPAEVQSSLPSADAPAESDESVPSEQVPSDE